MTPDDRTMLEGLFDRIRTAATGPRDAEAESFIANATRMQPYAPYLMAQTILVQEQVVTAASQRIEQLEAQVRSLQAASQQAQQQEAPTSFLGSISKSIFAGPAPARPPVPAPQQAPQGGPWGQPMQQPMQQPMMQQPMQGAMMGAAPGGMMGGGFLKGALGAAAGVAGGMLLADSVRSMMGGSHGGQSSHANAADLPAGDTVVNNYYGDQGHATQASADDLSFGRGNGGDTHDASNDDSTSFGGGGDDSTDV